MQQFLKLKVFEFHVWREHVLEDLLQETKKARFHPLKRVKVRYSDPLCCTFSEHVTLYLRRGLWAKQDETRVESQESSGVYSVVR